MKGHLIDSGNFQVDAALDSGARGRVADWMEMSKKAHGIQFITTTHRKELMEKADRFIGVKYAHQVRVKLGGHP